MGKDSLTALSMLIFQHASFFVLKYSQLMQPCQWHIAMEIIFNLVNDHSEVVIVTGKVRYSCKTVQKSGTEQYKQAIVELFTIKNMNSSLTVESS